MQAMLLEFEKGVREVIKEFPGRPEGYAALLQVADGLGGDKAIAIAEEIEASKAPEEIKKMAAAVLKKSKLLGSPLDIDFKAVDGREVNLAKLKGKVVLIDFWATWCGPCVAEVPKVVAAYEKLNSKGFEIVGISFDEDKGALESFVKKKKMAWPQYFDGDVWQNKFGQQYGINGIPTMWLVDKKGILRDMNAREDLVGKVEKMLAEN
jgi:thiol-disulfide isomerase/thioredoxin